jgi:GNAT superfamily N-acetyltransferase
MTKISLRNAAVADIHKLTEMNQELIKDENSENPMNFEQLFFRMEGLLSENWNAQLVLIDNEIIGYALYQYRNNIYYQDILEVYLRQYYIHLSYRGRGYGRAGINLLRTTIFPKQSTLIIDVLENNPSGQKFWASLGFIPYCTTMKMK